MDCRKEKEAAVKPEGQSGELICNNFIRNFTRTLTVWYDALPQESGQVYVCWLSSGLQKGLTDAF